MLNYLLGRSNFHDKVQVINCIKDFEKFDNSELLEDASALLIFKNDTQQCWLVFTNLRVYFVIDDTEKSILKALWARDKDNLISDGRVNLHLKEEKHSKETGKILFGNMNNSVLYTYSLFKGVGIAGTILSLMNKHFVDDSLNRNY
jgi:hypothetical protein